MPGAVFLYQFHGGEMEARRGEGLAGVPRLGGSRPGRKPCRSNSAPRDGLSPLFSCRLWLLQPARVYERLPQETGVFADRRN